MTSETSYTLCSSPSLKNSQNLPSVLDSSVTENLYLAQQKLTPVIDDVMKTAKENSQNKQGTSYYLTVEQYQDAIWASKILKEAGEVFVNRKYTRFSKKNLNVNQFNLEKKNVKINKYGKIYVDTAILIQLIELHNSLGEIINNIQDTPSEGITTIGTSSYTQTECSNERFNSLEKNNVSENKLNAVVNLQKKDSVEFTLKTLLKTNSPKENSDKPASFFKKTDCSKKNTQQDEIDELLKSITYPMEEHFLVMSAHTIKSTSVGTDSNCPCPKNYLSTLSEERTSNSEVKLSESRRSTRKTKSTGSIRSNKKDSKVTDVTGARNIIVKCLSDLAKVRSFFEMERVNVGVTAEVQMQNMQVQNVCPEGIVGSESKPSQSSCPAANPTTECDGEEDNSGSKLIICIKGKDDTDDVQIIIRQCSDCKSFKTSSDEYDAADKEESKTKLNYESNILHGKDGENCSVSSSSDGVHRKKSGLNVLFDPEDPSKSIVEPCKRVSAQIAGPIYEAVETGENIDTPLNKNDSEDGEDYSRIKLYETTNLCVSTEDGQELIISLTIRPKTSNPTKKLSLKDLFSESTTRVNNNGANRIICTNPECNRITTDRVIPLKRTKICSSLEFDVSVMDTRMRNKGIKHINPNIVVRLQELGVNNLLRACRPVKCGRQAILNETLRKCLPYSASLTSLPLEETDADIIDQSLNMSLDKCKTSKDMMNKIAYFTHLGNTVFSKNNMQVGFLLVLHPRVLFPKVQSSSKNTFMVKKLSFYINLVHDVENTYKQRIYEVRIFEVERYHNSDSLQNSTSTLQSTRLYRIRKSELKHESADQKTTGVYLGGYKVRTRSPQRSDTEKFGKAARLNSVANISGCSSTISRVPLQALKYNPQKHLIYNTSRQLEYNKCSPTKKLQNYSSEARKKNVSKIPVYKYYTHKNIYCKKNIQYEPDVYDISSQSLPRDENSITQVSEVKYHSLRENESEVTPQIVLWKAQKSQNDLLETENPQHTNFDFGASSAVVNKHVNGMDTRPEIHNDSKPSEDSFDLYFNDYFYDPYLSRPTSYRKQSSARLLKQRKKKSEYLLTKSRSEIFLNESKQNIQYTNITKDEINKNKRIEVCRNETLSKIRLNKYLDGDLKISNSTIQYVPKLFYEYLLKEVFLDETKDTILEVKDSRSSCRETLKNKCLDKILSIIKQRIVEETAKLPPRILSQPNVEAGMDSDDVSVQIEITRIKSINQEINGDHLITNYFENNISHILKRGISKSCQMPDMYVAEMKNQFDSINDSSLIDPRHSCDNFENFVVMFDSTTSTSLLSSRRDRSSDDVIDDAIHALINECSISKMRTLLNTDYGLVRKILETTPWKDMGMEPIQYFVYQHCNCMRSETFMEKLRAKSKAFIKSTCLNPANKCIVKYRNDRMLRGLQSNEDCSELICKKCGCYISPSRPKKNLDLTNYCSCTCPTHFQENDSTMKHYEGTTESQKHTDKHDNKNKDNSHLKSSSDHESKPHEKTGKIDKSEKTGEIDKSEKTGEIDKSKKTGEIDKSEKTVKETTIHSSSPHESTMQQQEDTDYPLCKCCMSGCDHCTCVYKPSCKTRLMSALEKYRTSLKEMPKKCMSTKKVGDELCLCRSTKNVGVRCLPDYVNVGLCTHFAEPKPKSYPCSHCLGKQDKGVDTKPSCRNTGIQCAPSSQMEKSIECNTNDHIISGNKSMPATYKALTPESSISSKHSHDSHETKDHNTSKASSNLSSTSAHDTTGYYSALDDE